GQTVAKGTDIKVVYSTGNVQVPDVRTETRESAEARLKAAGLKVKTVVETSDEEPGKVFKQIPVAKEWVKRGTEVTIFIPREVKKPDLSLEVTAPEQVQPGQSAAITASIQNRGEGDTSEPVTLQMKFPTEAVQIGALPQGCDVQQQGNEQIVTCTIQLIEAGDTEQVAFDVTIGLLAPGTTIEGPAGVQTEGDEEDGNNADTYRMTVAGQ
ncbi:MAG TPA: PASTA domain-containing protein, partial [Actinopolymorphaceae bacterium]